MPKKGRKTAQPLSPAVLASTLLAGGLLSLGLCGLGLAVCAWMVLAGRLGSDAAVPCCCVCLGIGCFIGGLYAALSSQTRMLAAALGSGLAAVGTLTVMGWVCFGGISPALLGGWLAVSFVGSTAAGLLAVRKR